MEPLVSAQEPAGLIAIKGQPDTPIEDSFTIRSVIVALDISWLRPSQSNFHYTYDFTAYTVNNTTHSDWPRNCDLFGFVLGACPIGISYSPDFMPVDLFALGGFNLGTTRIEDDAGYENEDDRPIYRNATFGPKLKAGVRIKLGKVGVLAKCAHQWEVTGLEWRRKRGNNDFIISDEPASRTLIFLGLSVEM